MRFGGFRRQGDDHLDTAEAADILETMDELARIACLRNLPIPVQVEILRAFNEQPRTAYLRYLGEHAPEERKAVGKGMLAAMTPAERKAAWEERKTMGTVTLEDGEHLDETTVNEEEFVQLQKEAKEAGSGGANVPSKGRVGRRASNAYLDQKKPPVADL